MALAGVRQAMVKGKVCKMLVIPAGIRAWSDGQESLQLYLQEDDFWSESDK